MQPDLRRAYNAGFTPALYHHYLRRFDEELGPRPFRIAETPLFMPPELLSHIERSSHEILLQLSEPGRIARMRAAIPARYDAPGMDALPNCAQLDFAVVRGESGRLEGRIVELQGFPSVYGLTVFHGRIFRETLAGLPGLDRAYHQFFGGMDDAAATAALRRTILGGLDGEDPEAVVTLDLDPPGQKTYVDFVATRRLTGVEPACVSGLVRKGQRLYRRKEGRLLPVRRIFNRIVFDELERRDLELPFAFTDALEVSWCPHPNWYWAWSKYSLLYLQHPAVPRTLLGSDPEALDALRAEPHRWVLKPLFSFAGSGVKVDATAEDLLAIAPADRPAFILQRKIEYARQLLTPDGAGVAAEVRVMCLRAPDEPALYPAWTLVRLSRGKLMGVNQNRPDQQTTWIGSSVALWTWTRS